MICLVNLRLCQPVKPISIIHCLLYTFPLNSLDHYLIASVKTDHKNFRILSVPSIEIINELLQDVLVISNISG